MKENSYREECYYVETELARVWRNSVAIEDFWVTTELGMTEELCRP